MHHYHAHGTPSRPARHRAWSSGASRCWSTSGGTWTRRPERSLQQPLPTWQDQERAALEEFVENRGRGFSVGCEITRELWRWPRVSPPRPRPEKREAVRACVRDRRIGFGQERRCLPTCIGNSIARDDVLLLAHAAGISPRSTQVDGHAAALDRRTGSSCWAIAGSAAGHGQRRGGRTDVCAELLGRVSRADAGWWC